jgi:predicted N-acyltransferase
MHRFYLANLDGKRGVLYLNGAFFDCVFRTMRERILLVLASLKRF